MLRRCKIVNEKTRNVDGSPSTPEEGWLHGLHHIHYAHPCDFQVSKIIGVVELDKDHHLYTVDARMIQFMDEPKEVGGRICEYFVPNGEPNLGIGKNGEWRKGLFHEWTTDHVEFENGPGLYPAAIVEDEDGGVHVIYAEYVRFPKE